MRPWKASCTRVLKLSQPVAMWHDKLLLRPIATNIALDWKSSCDHDQDRKTRIPTQSRQRSHEPSCWSWWVSRTSTLIATMLANELVDCDEGRTPTFADRNDNRERVPRSRWISRTSKFVRNESCNELLHVRPRWGSQRTVKIFDRKSERSAAIEARRLTRLHPWIDEIHQRDVRESAPIYGNEDCHANK